MVSILPIHLYIFFLSSSIWFCFVQFCVALFFRVMQSTRIVENPCYIGFRLMWRVYYVTEIPVHYLFYSIAPILLILQTCAGVPQTVRTPRAGAQQLYDAGRSAHARGTEKVR